MIHHQFIWVRESNVQPGPLPGGNYKSGYFKQNLLKVSYMACLKRKYKNKYKKKFFQNPDDFKSPILKKINLIIQNKVELQQKLGSKIYMDV